MLRALVIGIGCSFVSECIIRSGWGLTVVFFLRRDLINVVVKSWGQEY